MYNYLLINATPYEIRIALVEHGNLVEFYLERPVEKNLVGNIYQGKVVRVLPGMQAAFVDLGLERTEELLVFNKTDKIYPWDDPSEVILDEIARKVSRKHKIKPEKLAEYFSTKSGNRTFNQYQRYYTVVFRNGQAKNVYPSREFALVAVSEGMARFMESRGRK
jgi:Ribonuclease G/E